MKKTMQEMKEEWVYKTSENSQSETFKMESSKSNKNRSWKPLQ
jgi:hypothetical protein